MTTKPAITLAKGSHEYDGTDDCPRCLFEAYNYLKRQQFTAACPPGVSPALHIFGMRLNDALPDSTRQSLVKYLPNGQDPLAGTADDGHEETRGYIALDWLIRVYLLRFLELSPRLAEHAAAVSRLGRIDSMDRAALAGPVVRAARAAAGDAAWDAARDAAGDAAWDAAGDAAGDAAWDAAGDAAGDAAWDAARAGARDAARAGGWAAAGDAAWDAARAGAGDAAGDAAWDAAGAAAGDAAWDAARAGARDAARAGGWAAAGDAAWDAARAGARDAARAGARAAAWDAAWDAADKILNPTVVILQESALALYDQMIKGTWDDDVHRA